MDAIAIDVEELQAALRALPRPPTEADFGEALRRFAGLHQAAPEALCALLAGSSLEPVLDEADELIGLRRASTQTAVVTREEFARLVALPAPPPRRRVLRPGDGWYDE